MKLEAAEPADRRGPSPKGRARRSHAERTAETRGRILAAVVESIAEVGFERTTANEITRRSGVTWGAVQHHFGGKDGILLAVLEDSFGHFAACMADAPAEGTPLEQRVDAFVEKAWEHFGNAKFRSTFEILLHYLGPGGPGDEVSWQGRMVGAWRRIWRKSFGNVALSPRRLAVLQQFTVATLAGLASMRMLDGATDAMRAEELTILKQTLVRELERG